MEERADEKNLKGQKDHDVMSSSDSIFWHICFATPTVTMNRTALPCIHT